MSYYPAFLNLRDRRCVVIGGGAVAAAKAQALLDAGARVTVFSPAPCPELAAAGCRIVPRDYRRGDLRGALLAIDARGDDDLARAVRAEAEAQGVLLNVVDRPDLCDFIAPSVLRRGPLQVAVSTSGESPFLAGAVRRRLEMELGPEWAAFTRLIGRIRRSLKRRAVPPEVQAELYRRLLESRVLDLLREGAVAAAQREADRVLEATMVLHA